jgi:hypothetical protein
LEQEELRLALYSNAFLTLRFVISQRSQVTTPKITLAMNSPAITMGWM